MVIKWPLINSNRKLGGSAGMKSWSSPPTGAREARNFTGYSMKLEHFMKPIM